MVLATVIGSLSCGCFSVSHTAFAGGGPENVLLVVNPRSWASRTIANHYIHWRRIPSNNVLLVDWDRSVYATDVDLFRDQLLQPILEAIDQRKLTEQIDYVLYSSDFPYRVRFDSEAPDSDKFRSGSLTGLTYLFRLVQRKDGSYRGLDTNWYMRGFAEAQSALPSRGFRGRYFWNERGQQVATPGQHYVLSTMLGFSSGRGNSVPEILDYLRRAALADGTHPTGTVYFADSGDPHRSGTRASGFDVAIGLLDSAGVRAEAVQAVVPVEKQDVMGAMLGVADFRWTGARSRIRPGAICENLTSYGGILESHASQTPISELLRHGAAGTSGTVIEPYAIPHKFPDPLLHVHYARGCSLAEAFYQATRGPYQLLILGDALCQPWANLPSVQVAGIDAGQELRGKIDIQPRSETVTGNSAPIKHYELFVDGRRVAMVPPQAGFQLDTTTLADGHHELRVVAVEHSLIASQGRWVTPVVVNNHGRLPKWQLVDGETARVARGDPVQLQLDAPGAEKMVVFDHRRVLARMDAATGQVALPTHLLGYGPVRLQIAALYPDGPANYALAEPLELYVVPRPPLPNIGTLPGTATPGLHIEASEGASDEVTDTRAADWLRSLGVANGQTFRVSGYVESPEQAIAQFVFRYQGMVQLRVDGRTILRQRNPDLSQVYVPVHLESGWHAIQLEGRLADVDQFVVEYGVTGTRPWDGRAFRHR